MRKRNRGGPLLVHLSEAQKKILVDHCGYTADEIKYWTKIGASRVIHKKMMAGQFKFGKAETITLPVK